MDRSDLCYTAAIIVLLGLFMATLSAINRLPDESPEPDAPSASVPDDLAAELRRCAVRSPQDAEDSHCRAVWEENRRRFFGLSARSLPPTAAPAPPASGGAAP
jgi:conjugative transfer region protein TrbK